MAAMPKATVAPPASRALWDLENAFMGGVPCSVKSDAQSRSSVIPVPCKDGSLLAVRRNQHVVEERFRAGFIGHVSHVAVDGRGAAAVRVRVLELDHPLIRLRLPLLPVLGPDESGLFLRFH